jgi:L-amino acid N-acyltransferase YncA
MREGVADPDRSVFVSVEDGELTGFVICGMTRDEPPEPGVGELHSFFVGAGRWRRGTGRALMAAALADLTERGFEQATVWSFDANDRANAFYEAHGFTRDGAQVREAVWADILQVRYRRTLS